METVTVAVMPFAAIRSGQHRLAQHYIAERTILRPGGQWGPRLLRRATA